MVPYQLFWLAHTHRRSDWADLLDGITANKRFAIRLLAEGLPHRESAGQRSRST